MNTFFSALYLLQDQPGSLFSMMIPFGLIIVVFYFLIIRPQNKKKKETQEMINALKKNDRVVSIGGIRGTVVSVKDDSVIVKVDTSVKMEFSKSAIANVINSKTEAAEKDAKLNSKSKDREKEKNSDKEQK